MTVAHLCILGRLDYSELIHFPKSNVLYHINELGDIFYCLIIYKLLGISILTSILKTIIVIVRFKIIINYFI